MRTHLERAVKAYREGLEEADRLAKDEEAPYGPSLRVEVGSAYTDAVAETLGRCCCADEAVDQDALAKLVRGLDVSAETELFRGGAEMYLAGLISKLWLRDTGGGGLGLLAGTPGRECAEWLGRVFHKAGYPTEVIESAWRLVVKLAVSIVKKTTAGQGAVAKEAAAGMVSALLYAMPEEIREHVVDDDMRTALAEIGVREW